MNNAEDDNGKQQDNIHWKVNWDTRMIYMSKTITNKDLIEMFTYITTGENLQEMIKTGPYAEWTMVMFIPNN